MRGLRSALIGLAAGVVVLAAVGVRADTAKTPESASALAFRDMVKVLNHPRCMNCHTTVNWPTQGDDQHRHTFNIVRGADGGGAAGMRCTTCHQPKNQDSMNIPGAPNWRMAPLSMGWTGLSPGALCKRLLDPAKNGGRSGEKVIEHIKSDPLVLWAWAPGGERKAPEMAHAVFLAAAEKWLRGGATCPSP